jgi:hypothetical protein
VRVLRAGLWVAAAVLLGPSSAAGSAEAATRTVHRAKVQVSGQLVVSFHGDRAAGCETWFRCDVETGTIRWTPPSQGQLYAVTSGRGRPRFTALNLYGFGGSTLASLATVERRAADGTHLCADARGTDYAGLPITAAGRRGFTFGLAPRSAGAGGRAFPTQIMPATNCGGPLPADVLRGLPTRTVTLRDLRRGPTTIDLSGSAPFAAGGLAGTAVSTVEVSVGRLVTRRRGTSRREAPPRRPPRRSPFRTVEVEYRITSVTGSVPVDVMADPRTCAPLDACGLSGSLALMPGPAEGEAYLFVYGRSPRHVLERAVGLAPGRVPRRVSAYGYVQLEKATGTVAAALERDGAPACRDSGPVQPATLELRVRGGQVTALLSGYSGLGGADPFRTRCPGPLLGDFARATHVAAGRIPLRAFGRRRLTLRLDTGTSGRTPGFRVRSQPDLRIELVRERPEGHRGGSEVSVIQTRG